MKLLASTGIDIEPRAGCNQVGKVFFNSSILCLKTDGSLQAQVKDGVV